MLAAPGEQASSYGAVLVCATLVALGTLFAAAETAVTAIRRARVQQLIEDGCAEARSLQRLLENAAGFAATSQLITLAAVVGANTLLVAVFEPRLAQTLGNPAAASIVLMLAALVVVLVLVYQLGHALGLRHAETIALSMAPVARATVLVLWPVVKLLELAGRAVYRPAPGAVAEAGGVTEAGIMLQVDVAEEEGVLEEEEGEMIRSIFEFGDTVAREIMVPRIDIQAAEASATLEEALKLAMEAGHSRVPVFEETIDHIVGIFYVKDALRFVLDGRLDVKVREVMRAAYFVPETKKLDELLREMRSRRVHVAIVVDEYGGTAGLVTIEDILEEIVGEIQDEFDIEEPHVQRISEHEVVVDALMTLDEVNDLLSLKLEAEDVDTLGGFVYAMLGRVPAQGDELVYDGVRLVVEEVEGNRINKVRILKEGGPAAPESTGEADGAIKPERDAP